MGTPLQRQTREQLGSTGWSLCVRPTVYTRCSWRTILRAPPCQAVLQSFGRHDLIQPIELADALEPR